MIGANNKANSNMRQVFHLINGEFYSGAERVQDLLGHWLPEFGFSVTFVCVKPGRFSQMRHYRESPVVQLPMRRRVDVRPVRHLVKLVRESDIALLHAHTPRSLMIARMAAALTSVPVVYHVHSPTSRDTNQSLRNWLNSSVERFSLRGVDRLIAVSDSLAAHMQAEGVAPERIVTVRNGVPAVQPPPEPRATPAGVWTLGTVALFRPRKGLEVLLRAIARINQNGTRVRLRAIGAFESPEYEAQIQQLVAELEVEPHVQWVGFCEDVETQLRSLDLFVLPSLFGEGLPMVVLESMAAGVPVVATRVEGVPEAIRDGENGVLAQPGCAADLARAIELVLNGEVDWQKLRASSIARHQAEFSDRRMAQETARVYREVLGIDAPDYHAVQPPSTTTS